MFIQHEDDFSKYIKIVISITDCLRGEKIKSSTAIQKP